MRGRAGRSDVVAHAYLLYPEAAALSGEARYRDNCERILRAFMGNMNRFPINYSFMLRALGTLLSGAPLFVVTGDPNDEIFESMELFARRTFAPEVAKLFVPATR